MTSTLETEDVVALLPCPFCAGQAVKCYNVRVPEDPMHWVLCRDCHASPGDRRTEAESVVAWNTRAATPLERLREENARVIAAAQKALDRRVGLVPGYCSPGLSDALDELAALTPSTDDGEQSRG